MATNYVTKILLLNCDSIITQAQILYSIAVYSAPCGDNSPELSLALANRSACLQIGKFYEGALEDILLSFEAGYPESKR